MTYRLMEQCLCCCVLLRMLLGMMIPTFMLSMWSSNTATAAIMLPIAEAVMSQLETAVTSLHDVIHHDPSYHPSSQIQATDKLISNSKSVLNVIFYTLKHSEIIQ
jgi:di/tricarboxylate transporter